MIDKKKKVLVVDAPKAWTKMKPILEEQLDCEIDIFDQVESVRDALSSNGSYSLAVIDPYNSSRWGPAVQARVDFIKELNGQLPVLIFSKVGVVVLGRKYKLFLGENYQAHVLRKYGYEGTLLEEMRRLIGGQS